MCDLMCKTLQEAGTDIESIEYIEPSLDDRNPHLHIKYTDSGEHTVRARGDSGLSIIRAIMRTLEGQW